MIPHDDSHGQNASDCTICEANATRWEWWWSYVYLVRAIAESDHGDCCIGGVEEPEDCDCWVQAARECVQAGSGPMVR